MLGRMSFLLCVLAWTAPPQVVEEIAQQIFDRYVLVDEAQRLADGLLEISLRGGYDGIAPPSKLAEQLTRDLRRMSGDLHFAVEHDPEHASRLLEARAGLEAELPEIGHTAEELEQLRRTNYGFQQVERLSGNVALIELVRFDPLDLSRDTATAAMAFAANADAVIFDVRNNQGGKGDLVALLVSYFMTAGAELLSVFDRETGLTKVGHTLDSVPGKRMLDVPLFVVTGPNTASAAEAFAFTLQQVGRGTVVGEKTVGAAQGGGWVPVGDGFVVFIPTFRPFNQRTGKGWERTGVQPDLPTAADRALAAAHLAAVRKLDEKASRPELRWLLPLLEHAANGPASSDVTGLVGRYQGIEITLVDGSLRFLGASGVLREMTPLSDGTFLIEDASVPMTAQARVRFVRDADGIPRRLDLLTETGEVLPRDRL